MRAMALTSEKGRLKAVRRPEPAPGAGEVLLRVRACGVCRTDLHLVDGDLPAGRALLVPVTRSSASWPPLVLRSAI